MNQLSYLVIILSSFIFLGSCADWDYITYAQLWPPVFCRYKKCSYRRDLITGWNVHGVWPSSTSGRDPSDCRPGMPFNFTSIQPIYSSLQIQWADLLNFNNPREFWSHEWSKHGTCAVDHPNFPNELAYFRAGLVLKSQINITKVFNENQIVPNTDNTFTADTITAAFQKSLGLSPILECVKIDGQWYLSTVEVCFDPDLTSINCPRKSKLSKSPNPLEEFIQEILQALMQFVRRSNGNSEMSPTNTRCGDHEFYIPNV